MKRSFYTLLCTTAICLLAGCEKDAEIPAAEPVSYVCFYNGGINFYNNHSVVLLNNDSSRILTYNGVNNGAIGLLKAAAYEIMIPGTYRIAYTDSSAGRKPITDNIFTFEKGSKQTIYLSDSAGFFVTLRSDDTIERDTAMAQIRLIHLASDAPKVDFYIDTLKIEGLQQVGFRQITGYTRVKPNIKPGLRLRYQKGQEGLSLVRKSFALEAGKCYTFILRGNMTAPDDNPNKTINLSALVNQ